MKFWAPFFLVAVLGTAGVYYGAQPLWRAVGLTLPPAAGSSAPPASNGSYLRSATPAETPTPASVRAGTAASAVRHTPRLTPAPGATEFAASGYPPDRHETPAIESVAPLPPAATGKNLPPFTPGSKSWGMTLSRVSYYALSGENRGQLPGGSIMDIEDSRSTDKGVEMSMGQVERNEAMAGPYLVANVDLVRFNVPRGEVPPESVAILKQYYGLKGRLDQRIAALKKQAANANPYAAAYADAVQKYNDFGAREKQLTAQRDAASGADRMRYLDQLRGMIPEGQRLLRAVEEAKGRYNKWKTANPEAAPVDTAGDAQVQELRKQLAALEPQVKEIVQ
jgi:hypothetical protein